MTYSVSRRGNQYGIVDDSNMFIDDWAGKKAEADAKAHDLNNASSSDDDVVNVDGVDEAKESEPSARAFGRF